MKALRYTKQTRNITTAKKMRPATAFAFVRLPKTTFTPIGSATKLTPKQLTIAINISGQYSSESTSQTRSTLREWDPYHEGARRVKGGGPVNHAPDHRDLPYFTPSVTAGGGGIR